MKHVLIPTKKIRNPKPNPKINPKGYPIPNPITNLNYMALGYVNYMIWSELV